MTTGSGTTCTLRVTATERETARVWVRRQHFAVGRPIEFDETSSRIAPLEYALGALAGEVVNGLRALASRRRIALDQIEALITADVEHALAYLEVVGESGQPAIAGAHLKVYVTSPNEPAVRHLWSELADRLPLVCTMRRAFPVNLELIMTS